MISDNNEHSLIEGLQQLQLTVSHEPLMNYLYLLKKWNRAYNLTSIHDIPAMITKHLLDSLAISPWLKGNQILDAGAGAGLPGIPLAIANPKIQFTLLDSNGKKTRFMQEAKRVLKLDNVDIVESRAEQYQPDKQFDMIICRAFTEISQLINWTAHLIDPKGQWLAMKGHRPDVELQAINKTHQLHFYTVPGLTGERCCVIINAN